jgi:acetyl-CoA carboxylase biotin carboxylase subunit
MAIRRILIANRGEIALRVIRTCDRLGIESVLAASKADLGSLPARRATRTLCIGPAQAAQSYLSVETIVQAALGSGCDAIHPGYGFLSERTDLVRLCEARACLSSRADRRRRSPKRLPLACRSAHPFWSKPSAAGAGAA